MKQFVEAEGEIHLINPGLGEYTLCGDAFDAASERAGYEWKNTKRRGVTCPNCARIILGGRGVRIETN